MAGENKLQTIIDKSELDTTKAKNILEQFEEFFGVADEWESEAKLINITNASQTEAMARAKTGRKFLQAQRIDIEKRRLKLKEASLREGQVIDGIAKTLKAIIVPIETHLKKQEDFLKIEEAARQKAEVDAGLALLEKQRVEKEEADAKAEEERKAEELKQQQRIIEENKRLKEEADNKEIALELERKANEEKLAEGRRVADEKLEAERKENEAKLADERKKQEAAQAIRDAELVKEREQRQKEIDAEKIEQDKRNAELKAAQEETARLESEKLELEGKITCPFCKKSFDR